eukprot:COSAG01_NODE_433_length_17113_cov_23.009757_12_plen_99_part_00
MYETGTAFQKVGTDAQADARKKDIETTIKTENKAQDDRRRASTGLRFVTHPWVCHKPLHNLFLITMKLRLRLSPRIWRKSIWKTLRPGGARDSRRELR